MDANETVKELRVLAKYGLSSVDLSIEAADLIERLQAQLAAYQKYGEPCDWTGIKAITEENDRLKAENLDLAKMLAKS